jgi:single-stranded DNA-binding protein
LWENRKTEKRTIEKGKKVWINGKCKVRRYHNARGGREIVAKRASRKKMLAFQERGGRYRSPLDQNLGQTQNPTFQLSERFDSPIVSQKQVKYKCSYLHCKQKIIILQLIGSGG